MSFAQLNEDGKSKSSVKVYHGYNTFAYSAAIPFAPFGIKYQYCNSFDFYSVFRTDLNLADGDKIITVGGAKSIGEKMNIYVGAGYDISFSEPVLEGGFMLKFGKFAIDVGGGYIVNDIGYGTLGFGYNL